MKIFLSIIIAGFFLAGCGTTTRITDSTETIIKYDTIRVPVPVIEDTLEAKTGPLFIHAEKIVEKDTIIQVKYFPEERKIYIKAKPDTIIVPRIDTVQVFNKTEIKEEPSFWEKNFWYIISFLAAIIVIIFLIKK